MDCDHLLQEEIEYFKKFDHLTSEQREELKKDVLKLNKPDEYIMDEEDVEGFYKAKIQILEHDLARAAKSRDEYKMQLDAALKEVAVLKNIVDNMKKVLYPYTYEGDKSTSQKESQESR